MRSGEPPSSRSGGTSSSGSAVVEATAAYLSAIRCRGVEGVTFISTELLSAALAVEDRSSGEEQDYKLDLDLCQISHFLTGNLLTVASVSVSEVGDALAEAFQNGLVKKEDLFITTKLWNSDHGHVLDACKDSLKKLQLDYLDLYLIHFPVATRHTGVGTTSSALGDNGVLDIDSTISLETTWHAMEELVSMGLVSSIGISNTICRAWLRSTARRWRSLSSGGVCSVTRWSNCQVRTGACICM
ncbi:uncharacterized protein [Miscanthus floridulus]|uniref:uncharacterized protein n=1 Tax=Miscanthus floridulus TaxID=154761 RepID=UPI00345A85E2